MDIDNAGTQKVMTRRPTNTGDVGTDTEQRLPIVDKNSLPMTQLAKCR